MTVIEAVFESFVLIVILPIIGSGAGTLPRGVRVVSHDAFIDVVVVTGQRRSGIEKHLVFHRRNVFGRTVSVKNHVQQVGFGRLGLGGFRRGILYECNGFDQRGIGDRDEFDLSGTLLADGVFRNDDSQRVAIDSGLAKPPGAVVRNIRPSAVGRDGKNDRGALVGHIAVSGGDIGCHGEVIVFPRARLIVRARKAEYCGKYRRQTNKNLFSHIIEGYKVYYSNCRISLGVFVRHGTYRKEQDSLTGVSGLSTESGNT